MSFRLVFACVCDYRHLQFYDVADTGTFYGRISETKRIVERLHSSFDRREFPPVVAITGGSGCGKSSLLRAGVLAGMRVHSQRRYFTAAFRPTDFHDHQGLPTKVIPRLLRFIREQTGLEIDDNLDGMGARGAAAAAVERIESSLLNVDGSEARLVIGLDQFEEIVDALNSRQLRDAWLPLTDFLRAAEGSRSIGFALTLDTSRVDDFAKAEISQSFSCAQTETLDPCGYGLLDAIIREPFAKAGLPLSREVIDTLVANALAFQGNDPAASVLPLVALKLSRLFDRLSEEHPPNYRELGVQAVFDAAQSKELTLAEVGRERLEFQREIAELAEAAWNSDRIPWEKEAQEIDYFLAPLVWLAGPNSDRLILRTAGEPVNEPTQRITHSFAAQKLLVRAGGNRLRLAHEAVIHCWPRANTWFAEQAELLRMEARFRARAEAWVAEGSPTRLLLHHPATNQQYIRDAASILSHHWQTWVLGSAKLMSEEDRHMRDYCLAVFEHSSTPRELIRSSHFESRHVHLAAYYGLVKLLKKFVRKDQDCIHLTRKDGRTPLFRAVWSDVKTVRYLLDQGASPSEPDFEKFRPIIAPVITGDQEVFDLLLPHYTLAELDNPRGGTLIHECARYGRLDMLRQLVKWGVPHDQADGAGWLPLHYAAAHGQLEVFQFLVCPSKMDLSGLSEKDLCAKTKDDWNALHLAATNGHLNIASFLVEDLGAFRGHENAWTKRGMNALMLAAIFHHPPMVKLLLEVIDPNALSLERAGYWATALHYTLLSNVTMVPETNAVYGEQKLKIVQLLLKHGRTNPNIKNANERTALAYARRKPRILRELLNHCRTDPLLPIAPNAETPMEMAVRIPDWPAVESMLRREPAIITATFGKDQSTLLHLLAKSNAPTTLTAQLLKHADLNVNARNDAGRTPLILALEAGNTDFARLLLSSGRFLPANCGDISHSDLALVLHEDVEGTVDPPTRERLWGRSEESLTRTDKEGWTPLHIAALRRDIHLAEWILDRTTDEEALWNAKDKQEFAPGDYGLRRVAGAVVLDPPAETTADGAAWDAGLCWKNLEPGQRSGLFEQLGLIDGVQKPGASTQVHFSSVPFYDARRARLLRLVDPAWPVGLQLFFLQDMTNERLVRLDGTPLPIHELNSKALIKLTEANALDYLRFFCFFVRRNSGPFLIVANQRQKELAFDLPMADAAKLQDLARPARLKRKDPSSGVLRASATVWDDRRLLFVLFEIQPTGNIDRITYLPLAKFSVRVKAPISHAEAVG